MSKSEFDQYIALLSGLLRLSPTQREEIATELRDHLEERLGELLDQGMSRDKAIKIALEEFGDAAGLAGNFAQIFRRQRRRWMMRMTLGTAATIAAIAMMTSAFWPEGRPGPSPQRLVAQDKAQRAKSRSARLSPTREEVDLRTEANLRERVDVDYIDLAFAEVLEQLGSQADLQFYIKVMALEDLGIAADFPITISLKNVSVETALELILEQGELTYMIRDGVIIITTTEDAESVAEVRVYNCRDLLEQYVDPSTDMHGEAGIYMDEGGAGMGMSSESDEKESPPKKKQRKRGKADNEDKREDQSSLQRIPIEVLAQFGGGGMGGGGMGGGMHVPRRPLTREEQLMKIITTAVEPDSWEEVGGPGTIGEFDGMIVIRHSSRVHLQVEEVLQMLRDASSHQGWANADGRSDAPSQGGFGSGGGGGFF